MSCWDESHLGCRRYCQWTQSSVSLTSCSWFLREPTQLIVRRRLFQLPWFNSETDKALIIRAERVRWGGQNPIHKGSTEIYMMFRLILEIKISNVIVLHNEKVLKNVKSPFFYQFWFYFMLAKNVFRCEHFALMISVLSAWAFDVRPNN